MYFPISKKDFVNVFTKSVYLKIVKESSIKEVDISFSEYKSKLEDLYDAICNSNYSPNNPRDF